jgi:hypothetical protein
MYQAIAAAHALKAEESAAPRDRRLRIRAVVRPEPDVEKLARALLSLALDLDKRETETSRGHAETC